MVRPDCGVVCVKFCKFADRGRSWQAGDYSRHLIPGRNATITKTEDKPAGAAVKEMLLSNPDGLRDVIRAMLQEVLEAVHPYLHSYIPEMTSHYYLIHSVMDK
mgnify:CR=1 FL=1